MTQEDPAKRGASLYRADALFRSQSRQKGRSVAGEFAGGYRQAQRRDQLATATAAVAGVVFSMPSLVFAMILGVVMLFPVAVDRGATMAVGILPESRVVATIAANAECARYVRFEDRNNSLVGYLPETGPCPNRSYVTLPVGRGAAMLAQADVIETVEGPFDGRGVVLNVSATGLARAGYYAVAPGRAGGTIPVQSALEFASGQPQALGMVDKGKFLAVWGPSFVARYLPEIDDRRQFSVENLPCMAPMPGTGAEMFVMAGGLCGLMVGDTASLDNLSEAQRCLIVASHKAQLLIVGPRGDSADHGLMSQQFRALKERAVRVCLSKRLSGAALEKAKAELDAIPLPDTARIFDVMKRFSTSARGTASLIRDAGLGSDKLLAFDITKAERMIATLRQGVLREIVPLLDRRHCWGVSCPPNQRIDVALAIAEVLPDGRLIIDAPYQSRSELLMPRGLATRNTASTSKAMLLPFLLEQGIDQVCIPAARWPRALAKPVLSAPCIGGDLSISLGDALAVSSNDAFLVALSQVSEDDLKAYLRLLGYEVQPLSGVNLAQGIVYGWGLSIAPIDLIRNLAFMATGRPVSETLIYYREAEADFTFGAFVGARALSRARAMMAKPVTATHGTLNPLLPVLNKVGCGAGIMGKSGTADAHDQKARDRLALGAFICGDQRTRVFFSLFGAHGPKHGMGRQITSKTTLRVLGAALTAYAKEIQQ